MRTEEHFFTCPYCWSQISMVLDFSAAQQSFIEDCEVCCQPIQVSFEIEDENLIDFSAEAIQ